jgi:hypothetical protein
MRVVADDNGPVALLLPQFPAHELEQLEESLALGYGFAERVVGIYAREIQR